MHKVTPSLPPFGARLRMVALIPNVGRLYLDRWRAFERSATPYLLTGWGKRDHIARIDAAVIMQAHTANLVRVTSFTR
jgi:hypothetical protein